jgi:hypothetical protein
MLGSVASPLQAQSATAAATTDNAATATSTPFLLENVPMKPGGLEVFPLPTRKSSRIFAAVGTFAPHVAGKDQAGDWVLIYYFDGKTLKAGWSPLGQLALDNADLDRLPVIDPTNPSALPDLPYNTLAARPYGARIDAATGTPVTQPTSVPPSGGGNTGEQISPSSTPSGGYDDGDGPGTGGQ